MVYFIGLYFLIPMMRSFVLSSAVAILIPSAMWIGSIYVEEPQRQALIWIAIFLGGAPVSPLEVLPQRRNRS